MVGRKNSVRSELLHHEGGNSPEASCFANAIVKANSTTAVAASSFIRNAPRPPMAPRWPRRYRPTVCLQAGTSLPACLLFRGPTATRLLSGVSREIGRQAVPQCRRLNLWILPIDLATAVRRLVTDRMAKRPRALSAARMSLRAVATSAMLTYTHRRCCVR